MWIKFIKFLIGALMIPLCLAVTHTAVYLLQSVRPESSAAIPAPVWGFLIGFGLWLILFYSLPRPVKTYVFAHEMSHALWALLLGARVSGLKVGADGGSVLVSKSNFLIVLAPYCFPFYSFLLLLIYGLLSSFTDLGLYKPFWMGLLGLSWSFHVTFTSRMLREHQSDIASQGRLFSYTYIYLANMLLVCLLIVAMGAPTLKLWLAHFTNEIIDAFLLFRRAFAEAFHYLRKTLQ